MKILLTGDSITDMSRNTNTNFAYNSYGYGYPIFVEGELSTKFPNKYQVFNKGISGNRIVDLYARIKADCWNLQPDLISVLIGVNDVWHEIGSENGVDIERFERVYEMFITDTKKQLKDVKFMLLEPYILHGTATNSEFERFLAVKEYAKVVKKLAQKYNCCFVPLQEKLETLSNLNGESHYVFDGVHPNVAGAKIISEQWLKSFYEFIKQ